MSKKKRGEFIADHTTLPTVKHEGGNNLMVWGCMGWNGVRMLIEVEGKMDANKYCQILSDGMVESFEKLEMERVNDIFSRTITPNTHHGRPHNGLKTTILEFYYSQHSLQTLISLNTCGNISNNNFASMNFTKRST